MKTPGNKRKEFGASGMRCLAFRDYAPAPHTDLLRQGILTPHLLLWQEVTLFFRHRRTELSR